MNKEMCHKCKKYPAEYNQTYCEFCLGISDKDEYIERLKQALNEIRNYILELDDETDNSIYDIESGTRNEILDRIDKVLGDDKK